MQSVFDTNVLISAALTKGESRKAFELAQAIGTICYSDETFLELVATLEKPNFRTTYRKVIKLNFWPPFFLLLNPFLQAKK